MASVNGVARVSTSALTLSSFPQAALPLTFLSVTCVVTPTFESGDRGLDGGEEKSGFQSLKTRGGMSELGC